MATSRRWRLPRCPEIVPVSGTRWRRKSRTSSMRGFVYVRVSNRKRRPFACSNQMDTTVPQAPPRNIRTEAKICGRRVACQPMPWLPATPTSRGVLSLRELTAWLARNHEATTSQTGSPDAPSATGAQRATLYCLFAWIGLPWSRMSLMRLPIFAFGSSV